MRMIRLIAPILIATFCVFSTAVFSQPKYPDEVEKVLQKAKSNRVELEKALDYFYKTGDPLKIKAINFLVANMVYHRSFNYYWADSLGRRVGYEELDYPSFDSSLRAFEKVKAVTKGLHPVQNLYGDVDSLKAGYLIDDIDRAFAEWKLPWAKGIAFSDFCEYLLPYRASVEPLQDWRGVYEKRFSGLLDSAKGRTPQELLDYVESYTNSWFTNTFAVETRNDPLPRLGALHLLHRKKGACEDGADATVLTLRALGIPATIDCVPFWATSSASHFFYSAPCLIKAPDPGRDSLGNALPKRFRLPREPGKVVRTTFSKQASALAATVAATQIPNGFLRAVNYIDVTDEYWETGDIDVPLYTAFSKESLLFAGVFNTLDWRVVWWGRNSGGSVRFKNMGKGAVYLPLRYDGKRLRPAGYPYALGYIHEMQLVPDTVHMHSVRLVAEDRYLRFHPGKKYTLSYWDGRWKAIGQQVATDTTTSLSFSNVPRDALLLMVPEDSKHKERPFIVTREGVRVWF